MLLVVMSDATASIINDLTPQLDLTVEQFEELASEIRLERTYSIKSVQKDAGLSPPMRPPDLTATTGAVSTTTTTTQRRTATGIASPHQQRKVKNYEAIELMNKRNVPSIPSHHQQQGKLPLAVGTRATSSLRKPTANSFFGPTNAAGITPKHDDALQQEEAAQIRVLYHSMLAQLPRDVQQRTQQHLILRVAVVSHSGVPVRQANMLVQLELLPLMQQMYMTLKKARRIKEQQQQQRQHVQKPTQMPKTLQKQKHQDVIRYTNISPIRPTPVPSNIANIRGDHHGTRSSAPLVPLPPAAPLPSSSSSEPERAHVPKKQRIHLSSNPDLLPCHASASTINDIKSNLVAYAIAHGKAMIAKLKAREAIERYKWTAELIHELFDPSVSVQSAGLLRQELLHRARPQPTDDSSNNHLHNVNDCNDGKEGGTEGQKLLVASVQRLKNLMEGEAEAGEGELEKKT